MRIGIACRVLMSGSVGVKSYARNLVNALADIDDENAYRLYYHFFLKHGFNPFVPDTHNFAIKRNLIPNSLYGTMKRVIRPWRFLGPVDVFHAPAFFFDEFVSNNAPPIVITVHDIAYKLFPGIQTDDFRSHYDYQLGRAVDYAIKIITISDSTARDLEEHFPAARGKITTVYNGVERSQFEDCGEDNPFDFPYFLFVSTIEPRKNVEFLLRTYERVIEESGFPHRLVLVGSRGWLSDPIYEVAEKSKYRDQIIFTGNIPAGELPRYYKHADLFLFPSLYEGFGLTPLEAQAAGIPIIASNTSSMPEVLGEGAILLDPDDEEAWAEAAIKIIEDNELKENLVALGISNAKVFTWERTARGTLSVYSSIVGSSD
ncbi:MAG: glycosyltransferase family 4 protein [bacterium]|nr:glycosyltransferase family 4 protein [bacterium]